MARYLPQVQHSRLCRIATGQYTGDGTLSQVITGIGFLPKFVFIHERKGLPEGTQLLSCYTIDSMVAGWAVHIAGAGTQSVFINSIDSLDADGFTVDDHGTDWLPNKLGQVYEFYCLG